MRANFWSWGCTGVARPIFAARPSRPRYVSSVSREAEGAATNELSAEKVAARLEFESDEIRDRVVPALHFLLDELEFELSEDAAPIGPSTRLSFSHPDMDFGGLRIPAGALHDFVREGRGKWDGTYLRSKNSLLVRVEAVNEAARFALEAWTRSDYPADGILDASSATVSQAEPGTESDDDDEADVGLLVGLTPAVLGIIAADDAEERYPPILDGEAYVRISHNGAMSEEELQTALQAYLFELSASCGLELRVAARTPLELLEGGYDGEPPSAETRLRPLLGGPGVRDVLELYNRAVATEPPDLQIFGFAKVLEYVGATAVRLTGYQELRAKLASSRALDPDSAFLSELRRLFERQQELREDRRVMDLVVRTCCVADELRREAPECCEQLRALGPKATDKDEHKALTDFADRITATRNAVAHAKANYAPSSLECPEREHPAFARACRLAAEQAIRWFARTDPALRTVQRP